LSEIYPQILIAVTKLVFVLSTPYLCRVAQNNNIQALNNVVTRVMKKLVMAVLDPYTGHGQLESSTLTLAWLFFTLTLVWVV
jgi:hypothetical protein